MTPCTCLGTGVGTFGTTANVETLDVDAGIWAVANTQNYDAINIAAGATLTSGISVTESMTVTVGGNLAPTSGRAIDAKNGLADGSSLIVDVLAGGKIIAGDDAIRINKDFGNGTVTIDNAGLIQATGGQAIDLTVVTSDTTQDHHHQRSHRRDYGDRCRCGARRRQHHHRQLRPDHLGGHR